MKTLYFCKHCPQILYYSKGCNSFVGKTYVRLWARLNRFQLNLMQSYGDMMGRQKKSKYFGKS